MKAEELAKLLMETPDAEVLIPIKVTVDENGYKHTAVNWLPIEKSHVKKPRFGGNQIFLGQ